MTVPLTVDLDEAVLAELDALATRTSRSRAHLLADALRDFLAAQSWQVGKIEAGLAAADAGDFASDDDVARVAERFRRAAARSTQ